MTRREWITAAVFVVLTLVGALVLHFLPVAPVSRSMFDLQREDGFVPCAGPSVADAPELANYHPKNAWLCPPVTPR